GGGGGDGDGDGGDGDKKGKGVLREDSGDVRKIKVKVAWTYTGKKEESVLHWIAAVESYVYGQRIPYWDRVLMTTSCMTDDAMSFAISLQKEANCQTMIEYSQQTRIEDLFKAVRERFEDKNLARRTEMLILNIADRKWKSDSALEATMDEFLQCVEHGLTPTQILNNFARALPDPLRTQLYPRTKEEGMTYEKFNKIAIDHAGFLAEANYCHYWKDLQAGKKWQNRTISGNIPGKDNLLLTFEEGGVETLSYDQIDYGLEGGPNGSVVQEGDYAAVAARGGGRQGRGRGRGAVLQQDDENGYKPVEFMSRRLPNEKVAASTYERELFALREALDHWRHYLLGRHFKVYSDHETLRWLKTQVRMTPKLTRWAAEIDQYDFELKPVNGTYNVVADTLSRRSDFFGVIVTYLDVGTDLQEKIKNAYSTDPVHGAMLKRMQEAPTEFPNYRITEGLLFERTDVHDRLCIPNVEGIKSLILGECHDTEGHFGWKKTYANLWRSDTWPRMKPDCIAYVQGCQVCQRNKSTTQPPLGLLKALPIPTGPGDSVSIDFMDTKVKSRNGKTQVMVIVDRFSKYVVFVALPAEAKTELVIREFFNHLVKDYGHPLRIVSDRDSQVNNGST
ncbi:hypothetical protein CBR_g75742, partial [Chara braunii]